MALKQAQLPWNAMNKQSRNGFCGFSLQGALFLENMTYILWTGNCVKTFFNPKNMAANFNNTSVPSSSFFLQSAEPFVHLHKWQSD